MALYKYCNQNGKLILQNLEIKVTPPNELNDVCEMRPMIQNPDRKAWARSFAKRVVTEPKFYYANAHLFPNCKNFPKFQKYGRANLGKIIQTLEQGSPSVEATLQVETVDMVSKKWGVISFSTDPVEDQMWGLYAESHKGLAVEFNETNELFVNPGLLKCDFLQCEYEDQPSIYRLTGGVNLEDVQQFVRRKRTKWGYEKERRLIVPIVHCRKDNKDNELLYLFSIKPSVVTSVTFGLRTPNPLKQEILAALGSPHFQHVTKWHIVKGNAPMELKRVQLP